MPIIRKKEIKIGDNVICAFASTCGTNGTCSHSRPHICNACCIEETSCDLLDYVYCVRC